MNVERVRKELNLSLKGMAALLQLGKWGERTVRRWEDNPKMLRGPEKLLIEFVRTIPDAAERAGLPKLQREYPYQAGPGNLSASRRRPSARA